MATIGLDTRTRPRVSLAELLSQRDASIAVKPDSFALAVLRAKRVFGAARNAAWRSSTAFLALLAAFIFQHGLVLAGLAAFTLAAWQFGLVAGLIAVGASAFFLEARRR